MAKTQAHIRYRNKNNEIVPGVTTVLNAVLAKPALLDWAYNCGLQDIDYRTVRDQAGGIGTIAHGMIMSHLTGVLNAVLAKPALLDWAYNCGLQDIDYRTVRDQAGGIGTIAHGMIMSHLTGREFDKSDYSEKDISAAENSLIKYWDWEKGKSVKPVLAETPLVSELYQYGGTIDYLAEINGEITLIDFKTGKGIYPEMFYQVAAYSQLLLENGHLVKDARILRIGRDEQEGFEERAIGNLGKYLELYLHALAIYKLQKELK